MDKGTLAGIGLALFCIFASLIMDGGNPGSLIVPGAMLLVFGGTFGASMASGLMKDATGAGSMLSKALKAKPEPPDATIATMVEFGAGPARRPARPRGRDQERREPVPEEGDRARRRRHGPRRAARDPRERHQRLPG